MIVRFDLTQCPHRVNEYLNIVSNTFSERTETSGFHIKDLKRFFIQHESYLLIALSDDIVVGGLMLYLKREGTFKKLPLEGKDISLKKILPNLNLDQLNYCQVGFLAIKKEFRNKAIPIMFFKKIYEKAKELEIKYIFSIASQLGTRMNLMKLNNLGLPIKTSIYHDIKIPIRPSFNGYQRFLMMVEVL